MDESQLVLVVGRASLFMRKNKATQKMGARGVCMPWVVSVIFRRLKRSPPLLLIPEGVFTPSWLNKVGALVETNQLIYHQLLYNLVLSLMSITTLPFFRATLALLAACA